MSNKQLNNTFLIMSVFTVFILLFKFNSWSNLIYENMEVHSVFEAIGTFIVLTMSWVFYQKRQDDDGGKFGVLAMGFLAIGIVRLFISISSPGYDLRLLHYSSNIFGAILFAMVWIPSVKVTIINTKWIPYLVGVTIIIFGLTTILAREIFPKTIIGGVYTNFSLVANYLAAILFLIAMLYFLKEYYHKKKSEDSLVSMVMLLFSISSILSYQSQRWSIEWWGWHVVLMMAYIVMVTYYFRDYKYTRLALKKSAERYKQLFDSAPDGVIQIDSKATIIECNQAECDMLGYEKNELIGKPITAFLSKESLKMQKVGFPILMKDGHYESELSLIRKDGTEIPVWRNVNALYDK